jgi:hypothetical protein
MPCSEHSRKRRYDIPTLDARVRDSKQIGTHQRRVPLINDVLAKYVGNTEQPVPGIEYPLLPLKLKQYRSRNCGYTNGSTNTEVPLSQFDSGSH